MHKKPYKHRFIAGSSKCSTKPLSILLTKLLTHIKQGLQKYCETSYSRSGVNQMWILKNSKELLDHLKSRNFNHITSIKSFDFSTPYTTIPHQKLKSRLATIIRNSFIHKNGNRRYKFLVLGREGPYFVKERSDSKNKYCKRGYFRWGKISRKCWQDISRGGNFHETTPFSFINSYGFYLRVGVIFAKKTKAQKTRKLPPCENFQVYSTLKMTSLTC